MSTHTAVRPPSFAQRVTDTLDPKTWIVIVTIAIGWHSGRFVGVAWGVFATVFAAVLPLAFIAWGKRRGRWTDRHVGVRTQRLIVIPAIMAMVTIAIITMSMLHAPSAMLAVVAAMLTTLAALLVITTKWKISVHAAVSSGTVAMLALAYGPALLTGYLAVLLVAWSRVSLAAHTRAQVIVGAILGSVVAGATFSLIR